MNRKMIIFPLIAIGATLLTSIFWKHVTPITNPQATDPITATVIQGLKHREELIHSGTAYLLKENYYNTDAQLRTILRQALSHFNLPSHPQIGLWFLASDSAKVREDELSIGDKGSRSIKVSFDGNIQQAWSPNSQTVRQYGEMRLPMNTVSGILQIDTSSDSRKLSKIFQQLNVQFIRKEKIGGIETYLFSDIANADEDTIDKWWIAPTLDCMVVRHESQPKKSNEDSPIISWRNVTVIDEVSKASQVLWVPVKQHHIHYLTLKNNAKQEVWEMAGNDTLLSFDVNQSISNELFHLPVPPGTRVVDQIGGIYTIKGDTNAFQEKLDEEKSQRSQPDLESVDLRSFQTTLPSTKPQASILEDEPIGGEIRKVNLPTRPTMQKNTERHG